MDKKVLIISHPEEFFLPPEEITLPPEEFIPPPEEFVPPPEETPQSLLDQVTNFLAGLISVFGF